MTKQKTNLYIHKGYIVTRAIDFLNPNPLTIDVKWYTKSKRHSGDLRSQTLEGIKILINKEIEV